MKIALSKFGTTLVFRDRGREAFRAFESNLKNVSEPGNVYVDFTNVLTFSPSWGDEFLTPLFKMYGERLVLQNTSNSSVKATIKLLEEIKKIKFNVTEKS